MLITDVYALYAVPEKWPHTDKLNNVGHGYDAIVLGNLEKNFVFLIFYTQVWNNLQAKS